MVICIMVLKMTGGCKMCWSFFSIGHGKGPHDGVGVVMKRFLCRKQLSAHGAKLQNIKEVVMFLQTYLSTRPNQHIVVHANHSKESFYVSGLKMWIRCFLYLCVIMKIHSIYSLNKNNFTELIVKGLACFCKFCSNSHWTKCVNVKWIGH